MKFTLLGLLSLIATSTSALNFEGHQKLINSAPFPEDGFVELYDQDTEKRMEMRQGRLWVNKALDNGSVRVRIYPKTDKNLKSYMEDIQVFQKRTCKEFEQDIYIESANSKTLFTQCIMAYGQIIPTLRKVIQGESATFIFERIFPTTMTPQQRTDWLNYMSNLTLCNEQTENCTTSNSF